MLRGVEDQAVSRLNSSIEREMEIGVAWSSDYEVQALESEVSK